MATHEERLLDVLARHKTETTKIMGATLAKTAAVPVSDLSVYLASLKKKGYYIESDRGRPAHYWAPKGVLPIDGPASPDLNGSLKKKKMPKTMTDPALKAVKLLVGKAEKEGKKLVDIINEKTAELKKEEQKRAEREKDKVQQKIINTITKANLSVDDGVEVLEAAIAKLKG